VAADLWEAGALIVTVWVIVEI
jgi:hypothetical protein